jgi:ADP-heptose:LPS heptosyltransferase
MSLHSARRVLVCLRYGIGDVVMQTPALDILRHHVHGHIIALGARPAIELLEHDPRVDELACIQDWGLTHWGDLGTEEIRNGIRQWLAGENFDVILDPYHAVAAAQDILREQHATILDTGMAAQNQALQHYAGGTAAMHAATLEAWGLEACGDPLPRLHLRATDLAFAARFLREHKLGDAKLVAISRVASSELKRWPAPRVALVADLLIEKNDVDLLLFQSSNSNCPEDLRDAMKHRDRILPVVSFHLRHVAALLASCAAFIGNDTGLLHVASAVGTPALGTFGPTSPCIYLPINATALVSDVECTYRKVAEFGPPDCVVAGRCLLGAASCIESVKSSDVLDSARALIGSKAPTSRCSPCVPAASNARQEIPAKA